jgi:hypothetical protein
MKMYFADVINSIKEAQLYLYKKFKLKELISFYKQYYVKHGEFPMNDRISLFLDSGAFSAWAKNITIDIDAYIAFIKEYNESIDVYAVLDDINSAAKTWQNQEYMESKGLHPLPVFHYNEPIEYLERCLKYKYFALGGMVPISTEDLKVWLDNLWDKYLTNDDGSAKFKIHGFGMTSLELLERYPWFSVDSTSWVMTGRYGGVMCRIGDFTKVTISEKGNQQDSAHWFQLKKHDQEKIREYFKQRGYTMEELMADYVKRDEVNIIYFLELEKRLTEHPPRFKKTQRELFDL